MTFIQFCKSIGLPLTPAQKALCATSFDGAPVDPQFADIFGGHVGAMPADARTIVWLCGRASGKTLLGAAACLWKALTADLTALGKGEEAYAIIVAPDMKLARLTLSNVAGWLDTSALGKLVIKRTADAITLKRPDGRKVQIAVFAAGRGGAQVRGKTTVAASLDEACFFRDEAAAINDADIYNALQPRVIPGGFILLASTPWVQSGLLWSIHDTQFGKPLTAIVAQARTERMRTDSPSLLATIRGERLRDPDNTAREFDCLWLTRGAGGAFPLDALNASVLETPPEVHGLIYIGGDLGFVRDQTAFCVVQAGPNNSIIVRDVLELQPKRGEPLGMTQVLRDAAAFAATYHTSKIRVDHHAFAPAIDAIKEGRLNLTLEPCAEDRMSHEHRYIGAINAFKEKRVAIPKRFGRLADQLARIVATPKPGGGTTFAVPRSGGNHCDLAMAFLLAAEPIVRMQFGINSLLRVDYNKLGQVAAVLGGVGAEQFSDRAEWLRGLYGYVPSHLI